LLARAAESGATVLRGHAARGVTPAGAVDAGDGGVLDASAVLLATGKHELRGMARTGARVEGANLVGFKTYYRLAPAEASALAGHIEIVLFRGGYAGLQPVEGGQVTLCLLVSRAALRDAGGGWDSLLDHLRETAPHLARRLTGASALRKRPVAIAAIPYGFVHRPSSPPPAGRVFRLGDQVGVIPSLAGDGIAIALHTGQLAALAVLDGADPAAYHRRAASDLSGQIGRAMLAHGLARRAVVQPALVAACRTCPSLMRMMAARTRVRADAAWRLGPA
jgi:flavin-dependent dehydrogenase